MSTHFSSEVREGLRLVTARDGLFDLLPESEDAAPLAAEVVAEFRSTIAGAASVVVDLRRAGEVNKRTLSVSFQLAREATVIRARQALCGSANLKKIWYYCKGGTVSPCFEDLTEAIAHVTGATSKT